MPLCSHYPTADVLAESQHGLLRGRAGEDAVAAFEVPIKRGGINVNGHVF